MRCWLMWEYSYNTLDVSEMLFCILLASLDVISTATPITICEQTYLGRLSNLLPDNFPLVGFVLSDGLTQRYRLKLLISQRPF